MAQPEMDTMKTGAHNKEWRRPVLRKLPIAETASKQKGNEGVGGGKGDNAPIPS